MPQSLKGTYRYSDFELLIDQIPKDPYAPPHTGVYHIRVLRDQAGFPADMMKPDIRSIAFLDVLTREIHAACEHFSERRGTGNSGIITIAGPGQEILERTAVIHDERFIEARMFLGLPVGGRTILADIAVKMFFEELPAIVNSSLFADADELDTIEMHLRTAEDAEALRNRLQDHNLAAFRGLEFAAVLNRLGDFRAGQKK